MSLGPGDQAVPVEGAEQSPDRDRPKIQAIPPQFDGSFPHLQQPAELLLPGASIMYLGHCEGEPISLPCFPQQRSRADQPFGAESNSLDISVGMPTVSPVSGRWIQCQTLVEQPLTGEIVVDPDDVGRAGIVHEESQFLFGYTRLLPQVFPEWVPPTHPPAEQVKGKPTTLVLELGLIGE